MMQSLQDVIQGQPASASANAQKALQLLPKHAFFIRSYAAAGIAAAHQMEGNWSQGLKVLRDALAESECPAAIRTRIWLYLCAISFMDADSSGAFYSGRHGLKISESTSFIQPRSNMQYYLGATHYLRNELAEAKNYLTEVIINHAVSEAAFVAQASGLLGLVHLAEGRAEEAGHILDSVRIDDQQMQDGFALVIRDALLVEFALRQGKIDEARRLSVGVDFDLRAPHWFQYVPQLTHVKLLLADGTEEKLKEARTRLVEMDEVMRKINRKSVRIDVLVLLALVCQALDDEEAALEKLRAALDLAEPGGWIRNFVDLGAPMAALLERLIQLQPGHNYTQKVIDTCRADASGKPTSEGVAEPTSSLSGQATDPILSAREIDILHLLADGLSNKEIASRLFIAPETVKTHLQNIYRKLDAKGGRVAALKTARTLGLVAPD